MRHDRRGTDSIGVRLAVAAAILLVAGACTTRTPNAPVARATDDPSASPGAGGPIAEVAVELEPSIFPRSVDFAGASFAITGARVTNVHPYTLFGEPRPAAQLFGILSVEGSNPTTQRIEYVFGPDSFHLRTWSARRVPPVDPVGTYDFSTLGAGERARDEIVFPLDDVADFEDAALLVGEPPDAVAILPVVRGDPPATFPVAIRAAGSSSVTVTPVAWTLVGGELTLDRPPGVCCPATGIRADDGEAFFVATIRGTVSGSQYGQATVTSREVRLVVDGTPTDALRFQAKAGVREGESFEFDVHWLIPSEAGSLVLSFGAPGSTVTIPIDVGGAS